MASASNSQIQTLFTCVVTEWKLNNSEWQQLQKLATSHVVCLEADSEKQHVLDMFEERGYYVSSSKLSYLEEIAHSTITTHLVSCFAHDREDLSDVQLSKYDTRPTEGQPEWLDILEYDSDDNDDDDIDWPDKTHAWDWGDWHSTPQCDTYWKKRDTLLTEGSCVWIVDVWGDGDVATFAVETARWFR